MAIHFWLEESDCVLRWCRAGGGEIWMSITGWWQWERHLSGGAHTASCTAQILDRGCCFVLFLYIYIFLIHSALVSASVLHELWFWNQMEVVKEVCLICFTHVGTPVLFTDPLDPNGSAFCFWSVAKCLPNTDGAQQWIFFLKVENWTERLAMTLLYELKKKKKKKTQTNVLRVHLVFYPFARRSCCRTCVRGVLSLKIFQLKRTFLSICFCTYPVSSSSEMTASNKSQWKKKTGLDFFFLLFICSSAPEIYN